MGTLTTISRILVIWTFIILASTGTDAGTETGEKLYDASQSGDLPEVRKLAGDNCTGVKWKKSYPTDSDWTPLHVAARFNHTSVAMFLVGCNADVNAQTTPKRTTPLHHAARFANVNLVYAILAADPVIDVTNQKGRTPLMTATRHEQLDTTKVLLLAGADVNKQQEDGWTSLMLAASNGYVDITNTLLDNDANVQIQNQDGETALYSASRYNHIEIVKTLLVHGANTTIKTNTGDTAEGIAEKIGNNDIAKLIKQHNIRNSSTEKDTTYTTTAIDNKKTTIINSYNASIVGKDNPTATSKPYDNDKTAPASSFLLLLIVIVLAVLVLILTISLITVGCYFKSRPPILTEKSHAVSFNNAENRESLHIYEI